MELMLYGKDCTGEVIPRRTCKKVKSAERDNGLCSMYATVYESLGSGGSGGMVLEITSDAVDTQDGMPFIPYAVNKPEGVEIHIAGTTEHGSFEHLMKTIFNEEQKPLMNTEVITKLKQSYERLQASFTMQNKLDFDQVVWSCLPELWKVEQKPVTSTTVARAQSPIPAIIRNYLNGIDEPHTVKMVINGLSKSTKVTRQQVEYVANKNGNPQKVLRTCDAEFLTYADQPFQNRVRVIYPKDSVEHPVKPIRLSRSPSKPKPIKSSVTTPFIEWFEANYELADVCF